jgi:DNA-directed RNA polymerase specialized sigma24 family protein
MAKRCLTPDAQEPESPDTDLDNLKENNGRKVPKRKILELLFIEGLKLLEVAKELAITSESVRIELHRARKDLRESFPREL